MKPSIGRIVIYRSLDGVNCAAIITGLGEGDRLHLHVFWPPPVCGTRVDPMPAAGVPQEWDEEPGRTPLGCWRWPERV